jgi:hypothetical protein
VKIEGWVPAECVWHDTNLHGVLCAGVVTTFYANSEQCNIKNINKISPDVQNFK